MLSSLIYASLGLCASAFVLPPNATSGWKFTLEAKGNGTGLMGKVGQLGDGQNRIGGNYPVAEFTYFPSDGIIVDSKNRGCIITAPKVTQWQCDQGKPGTYAMSLV